MKSFTENFHLKFRSKDPKVYFEFEKRSRPSFLGLIVTLIWGSTVMSLSQMLRRHRFLKCEMSEQTIDSLSSR